MNGFLGATSDGFSSFFSIWQVCILQISPFFLAWVTGLYFAGLSRVGKVGIAGQVVIPGLCFSLGFVCVYALLTMTGLPIGRILVYNLWTLGFVAGGYILAASLYLMFSGLLNVSDSPRWKLIAAVFAVILGSAFAATYSPCITPALSKIMGLAGRAETSVTGGILAAFYGLGICLALILTGSVLVFLLTRFGVVTRNAPIVRNACACILAVLGILNLSGTMIYYKAFFLGFLVG